MSVVSIDLDPVEEVLDGRHLSVIIERWLDECTKRLPAPTVVGYAMKVRFFLTWWTDVGPAKGWQLQRADLYDFVRALSGMTSKTGRLLSYYTRRDALRRLRSALLWAYRKGYTRHLNVAAWVPTSPDGSAPLHLALSIESLAKLMWTAADLPFATRNQALLAIFIGTGARLAEVANLSVNDVTLHADHSGRLHIRAAKHVPGRDVHQRAAIFDRFAGVYIARWLDLRGSNGPLWVGADGEPIGTQAILKNVRIVAAAAGVTISGTHDFRRTFATFFADKRPGEGHYHLLRMQIGHAPQGTTRKFYDLRGLEHLEAIFTSPMEDIAPIMLERGSK